MLLAQHLIEEKHDVSLIEENEERARNASNHLDCLVINNSANSLQVLEDAGISKADALVCVTDSDEMNIIICGLAPDLIKIARVRNEDYIRLNNSSAGLFGINKFIHPDEEVANSVLQAIEYGAMGDILPFENTSYVLGSIEVSKGSAFDMLPIANFRSLDVGDSLVTLIERNVDDSRELILPSGSTVIEPQDRIHILTKEEMMERIYGLAGWAEKPLRKIGIVGGGRLGTLIAEGLMEREENHKAFIFTVLRDILPRRKRYEVVIIEQNESICRELASRFPDALILNEDISNESFVAEERIDDLDLIITTTNSQELNIITAVYLKSRGVGRTIAMVTGSGYAEIARQLGVDVVIPMKSVVADSIHSHLMGTGITGIHRLGDGSIKILELSIGENSPVLSIALKDCKLPANCLIMLIERRDNSFIPKGSDSFEAGDRIILITHTASNEEIFRFFGVSFQQDTIEVDEDLLDQLPEIIPSDPYQ